jgi:hypothetical protein
MNNKVKDGVLPFRRLATLFDVESVGGKPLVVNEEMPEQTRKTVLLFLGKALDAGTQAERLERLRNVDELSHVLDAWDAFELASQRPYSSTEREAVMGEIRRKGNILAKFYTEAGKP